MTNFDDTLSFEEVKSWLRAAVGGSVSVHIVNQTGTIAFLDGVIENLMRFETTDSHGLIVEGAARAWTLELAAPEYVSATLSSIPDSPTHQQLTIKSRNHWVMIEPGLGSDGPPTTEP